MKNYHQLLGRTMEAALQHASAVAVDQIDAIPAPEGSHAWCVLDLGTADGLNSIPFFKKCVKQFQHRNSTSSSSREIALVFEDGPWNDFSLISKLDAVATFGDNVFPSISNCNFFSPTVPSGTVDLAFSSAAMHYLSSGPPCNLTGLHPTDAVGSERLAFSKQAACDWLSLLLARAVELAPGGRLVVSNFCIDETTGWYMGCTDYGASIYTTLSTCMWNMVRHGRLTQLEYEWATSPEYYRTVSEHTQPFQDKDGPVRQAGLVLRDSHVQVQRCPLRADFVSGKYDTPIAFGRDIANAVSAFAYSKVSRAFKHEENNRSPEECAELVDELFGHFAAAVADIPLSFGIDNVMVVLVIQKDPHHANYRGDVT